jgi:hypothetical protein
VIAEIELNIEFGVVLVNHYDGSGLGLNDLIQIEFVKGI